MLGGHYNTNSSTGIEIDFDPAPTGIESTYEIVEKAVGKVFVESALITECPEVKLERF